MTTTTTLHAQRRTYTTPRAEHLTPAGHRKAERHALALARESDQGWEHYAGDICYVVGPDAAITRIESIEGRRLNERRIAAKGGR